MLSFNAMSMGSLILILILAPVFASSSVGFFGRYLGVKGVCFISIFTLIFLFGLVIYILLFVLTGEIHNFYIGDWIDCSWGFGFSFILDILNIQMCFIILLITLCVILYSVEYMSHDPHLSRFLSYLLLFMFFMLFLVLSGNLTQLFIGWEGVGLVSYLLVNFWFTRLEANRAAIKAVLFNRVGDVGYIAALVFFLYYFKTTEFNTLFLIIPEFIKLQTNILILEKICILIFIGAMGKSAQLGLHAWLPDAMEGPTPVSALLHSATMVTAGIFVLLRCSKFFIFCPRVLVYIAIIGGITSLFSGSIALFQNDLKKIIAYSTCSQLGFMVAAFGLLNINGCFFHLINHAFFKALLFLTAGCVIHALFDEQDLRKMGGLFYYMPLTGICMLIGFLGLVGFPFLSGYYSKEQILFMCFTGENNVQTLIFIILMISSFFTVLYSCRVLLLVFYTPYRGFRQYLNFSADPGIFMAIPIIILSFLTIIFGFVNEDLFVGLSNTIWANTFVFNFSYIFDTLYREIASFFLRFLLSFLFLFLLIFYFFFYSKNNVALTYNLINLLSIKKYFDFLIEKWWFSSLYRLFINFYLTKAYKTFLLILDRGVFERIGPFGISNFFADLSRKLRYIQNRFLTTYFLLFVCGIFFCFLFLYMQYLNYILLVCVFVFYIILDIFLAKRKKI